MTRESQSPISRAKRLRDSNSLLRHYDFADAACEDLLHLSIIAKVVAATTQLLQRLCFS